MSLLYIAILYKLKALTVCACREGLPEKDWKI